MPRPWPIFASPPGQPRARSRRRIGHFTEIGLEDHSPLLQEAQGAAGGAIAATRAEGIVVRDFAYAQFAAPGSPTTLTHRPRSQSVTQAQLDGIAGGLHFGTRLVAVGAQEARIDWALRRPTITTLPLSPADSDKAIVTRVYTIARKICALFEFNNPFSLHHQPVFHDPYGPGGYLSFRRLSPEKLARELRPYILQFRHSLYLVASRIEGSPAPPLPPYCRHLDPNRGPTRGQSIFELLCDACDGYDVTGFYLLCEIFWRLIAENRRLFGPGTATLRSIAGFPVSPLPSLLRTKFDSVLDLAGYDLDNEGVHFFATEEAYIPYLSLDKLRACVDIPPPLQKSADLLAIKFSDATASDHFRARLQDHPIQGKSTIWDHLQYLPESPLDFDPNDPNVSTGSAHQLGHLPANFTTLKEYEEQTPSTYFSAAKPTLHLYAPQADVILPGHDVSTKLTDLLDLSTSDGVNGSSGQLNGHEQRRSVTADVMIESTSLLIWAKTKGVRIEYPTIGIHGISTVSSGDQPPRALFLQLNLYDQETSNSDNTVEIADVLIVPSSQDTASEETDHHGHKTTTGLSNEDAVKALYEAVSNCQNLHPDPREDDDEENDQQASLGTFGAPGDGGWITSENMAQFVDSNGNFVGFGASTADEASAVAGTRRSRTEDQGGDGNTDDGETKWRRTD